MTDVTPPTPPGPKAAAKGVKGVFKGKPAWVWVAGVTVLLGVAYMVMARRNTETPGDTTGNTADDGQMAVGDYGGYYPVSSEGAYGGYDNPQNWAPVTDNAGNPEPSPITVNVTYPAPTGGGRPAANGTGAHAPPGSATATNAKLYGGKPLAWWQNPANGRKRVKVKGKWVQRWRWPGGGGYKHTRPFAGRS